MANEQNAPVTVEALRGDDAEAMALTDLSDLAASAEEVGCRQAGHWDTPEGAEMAKGYAGKDRSNLLHGEMSDFALANRQYMAGRSDIDLVAWQTAAKERIRWLSVQLALATPTPPAPAEEQGEGR